MMLADHILAARGTVLDFGGMMTSLGAAVERAQRFQLGEDAALACLNLLRGPPSTLIKTLPLCRLPYPATWIEMRGGFAENPARDRDAAPIPVQQGTLIEGARGSSQAGSMTVAWVHKAADAPPGELDPGLERAANGSPFAVYFDFAAAGAAADVARDAHREIAARSGNDPIVRMVVDHLERRFLAPLGGDEWLREWMAKRAWWRGYAAAPRELEALREHHRHMVPGLSAHGVGTIVAVLRATMRGAAMDEARRILANWEADVEGEGPFGQFFLALLNSRNCVEREPVDLGRLNKARGKRGKRPLLGHTRINLVMSRARRLAAAAGGMSREEARQHLVRGHFKVRRTGLYWWNPFLRGDPARPMERARYEVAP